jgi:hypothetical protein
MGAKCPANGPAWKRNYLTGSAMHTLQEPGYHVRKNEVGNRYGMLVVTEFSHIKNDRAIWVCVCDCGGVREVAGTTLRAKGQISCGCQRVIASTKTIEAVNKKREARKCKSH